MSNKILTISFLILGCLMAAKLGLFPQPVLAQGVPPGMEQCDTLFCSSGPPVIQFCQANTTPRCQFGCFTTGSCTTASCDANSCQQSAGNTVPGHPCTGTCQSTGCVTNCPYCQIGSPQQAGCGQLGCGPNQMAYAQNWFWTNGYQGIGNGQACSSIPPQVTCQADSSCTAPCIPGTPGCGGQGPTHLACSGNSCISTAGAGANTCNTNADCNPTGGGACLQGPTPPGCGGGLCCSPECDNRCDSPDGENAGNSADCPGSSRTCGGGGGGGGGTGTCTPTIGPGGGCGTGQPGCCDSGLSCRDGGSGSGTCQPPPGGGACPMPHSLLIYPKANNSNEVLTIPAPNMVYGSTTGNLPFRWSTNGNPGASCTNGADGLWANLFVDGQIVEHNIAPGYGEDGQNPNAWDFFPHPASYVDGNIGYCATSADPTMPNSFCDPGNWNDPQGNNWRGGSAYTGAFTPTPGVIHTWWVEYTSPNGREGGTVRADNWTLGRFMIAGGPPVPICQSDPRDPYPDLCNIPSPLSYSGVTRHSVSVLDNGTNTTTYLHNFTILNNSNPADPNFPLSINNVPGTGGSVVSAAFPINLLTQGDTYEWFASSVDPNTSQIFAQTAIHWHFVYDTGGPVVTPNMTYGRCYVAPPGSNNPPPLRLFVMDSGSGVKSVSVTVSDNGTLANIPLAFDPSSPGTPDSGYYTAAWSGLAQGHTYSILAANATDNAGNSTTVATPNMTFLFSTACTSPWLQTQQGDVHSNVNINTPGGP